MVKSAKTLLEQEGKSDRRIVLERFRAKARNIIVIKVYSPTNIQEDEIKAECYDVCKLSCRNYKRKIKEM